MSHKHHKSFKENWFIRNWHPLCGLIFLLICLTDFIIMPIYFQYENSKYTPDVLVSLSTKYTGGDAQVQALNILHEQKTWTPMTLSQNGLFFVAFGAILSAGIWSTNRKGGSDDSTQSYEEFLNAFREMQGQTPINQNNNNNNNPPHPINPYPNPNQNPLPPPSPTVPTNPLPLFPPPPPSV